MRLREIDILRGIAIILVIVGHSFILHPVNIHDVPWCLSTFKWIYTFHMELFFLVAGCVYHCVNYKQFIRKKIDRILVPYIIFGLASMVLAASGIGAVNRHMSWLDGLNKLLFHGGEYWFLYVLFIIFAIFPLIDRVLPKGWQKILLILILMVLPNMVNLTTMFMIYVVVYQLPYFIIGFLVAKYLSNIREIKFQYALIASITCIALYAVVEPKIGIWGGHLLSLRHLRALLMIIPIYFFSIGLLSVEIKSKIVTHLCHFLEDCSKYSLQLYLFNGFILVAIRVLMCNILHIESPILIVLGIVLGNIIISLTLCKYVIPRSKVLSYICGIPYK